MDARQLERLYRELEQLHIRNAREFNYVQPMRDALRRAREKNRKAKQDEKSTNT